MKTYRITNLMKTYKITEGFQGRAVKRNKAEENFFMRYIPKDILKDCIQYKMMRETEKLRKFFENKGWARREEKYDFCFEKGIDAIYTKGTRTITINVYDAMLDD